MPLSLRLLSSDQRGVVLVMALILMGLLSALAAAYSMIVKADTVLRGAAGRTRHGFYAAEAGLNVGMAEFANIFKHYGVPTDGDFEERSVTVGDRTVYYQLAPVPGYDPCTEGEDEDCYTTIPAGEKFAGLKSIPYRYTVRSTAINAEGDEEAELGAEFDIHNIPIFQFLAFYANDLEILPGPDMNLHGRIHTNGNLYLNANNTLTIGDLNPLIPNVQVSAAQNIYRGRKDNGSCGGTVIIDKLEDSVAPSPDYDPLPLACTGGSAVSQTTLEAYKGSLLAGVDTIQTPSVDEIKRGGSGVFWQRADLRIVLRLDLPKASIDFAAADLCPGGPGIPAAPASPALYPIEVQNADGSRDTVRTTALWRFMCERRGAIFYNDVPNAPASVNTTFPNTAANYSPAFGATARIYRRAGEDTSGDGVITNKDRNDDICPKSLADASTATRPWWTPVSCPWPNASPVASSWFQDMDYRRGGFYNNREGKWIYLLNVNMRALLEWNAQSSDPLFPHNDYSDGGLVIFLSVQGPASEVLPNNYGVRIFDSSDLDTQNVTFPPTVADPSGLTVVSDQAVYIEGNYNFKDKYPAAVIGDSLNVLSQGWEVPLGGLNNDRKSAATLSSGNRNVPSSDSPCGTGGCGTAFSTSTALGINAALISGVDNTTGSSYNGGLENYPRFHESWSGRTLNYRGSLVSLGPPQHVNGAWCGTGSGCNIYNPPSRDWDYDADFNLVEKLPPLTPKITYVQQRLYTRFYK
jgi:hypothetical protein